MAILNTPIRINQMQLKNRLVMPPMATRYAGEEGEVTDALCDYYREKAASGCIGLVITEHSYIDPSGRAHPGQVSIASDADIPGLRRVVEAVHSGGTKVMAQINHAGSAAYRPDGSLAAGAGMIAAPGGKKPAQRPMRREEIDEVVAAFARAARRAQRAGYDGVEIHAAHGYLLSQFYSPLTNDRTDEYTGATLAGRIRLHLQVIHAVRGAVGPEYPVALRFGGCDYIPGGATIADSVAAAKEFAAAGLDLLDLSGGFCGFVNPNRHEPGYFGEMSGQVRRAVNLPVLLTGGVTEVGDAEALLRAGKADLIGVGRAILKDSGWPARAMAALAAAGGAEKEPAAR